MEQTYLKIKDDINLEELEKFGFQKLNKDIENNNESIYYKATQFTDYFIYGKTRIIRTINANARIVLDPTLYDLQEAGMIEKFNYSKLEE